ncbi:hypothetical protein SEA_LITNINMCQUEEN_81 [Gordonia phage LitninMcQueen]
MRWPWKRKPTRTLWLTCWNCGHDLNGDGDSFVEDEETRDSWVYECASCRARSVFSLAYPTPVLIDKGDDHV